MKVEEFRSQLKMGQNLIVDGKSFSIKEIVKFRFDDGSNYIKCFLNDGYVFADDLNDNIFILVKEVKTLFSQPFPESLEFQGKDFKFSYSAHAIAEEIWGEEIFKKGNSEFFWDYKAEDKSYLSLGIIDETKERLDFFGGIVENDKVELS